MSERLTMTVPEAAELLGVSRGTAYEAARSGDLPTVKIGRRRLVPRARLLAMLGEDPAPSNGNGTLAKVPLSERLHGVGAPGHGQPY